MTHRPATRPDQPSADPSADPGDEQPDLLAGEPVDAPRPDLVDDPDDPDPIAGARA